MMTKVELFDHMEKALKHMEDALAAVRRGEVTPEDARAVRGLGRTLFRYSEALSHDLSKVEEREGK
jgi:hypothetical protein